MTPEAKAVSATGTVTTAGEPEFAVTAKGLSRSFGNRPALAGVDLSLAREHTLAVFGPNGSGKSTLLKLLATLLRPGSGQLSVLGCGLPHDARRLRTKVGYIGHEPLLYRELTPVENLCFYGKLYGVRGAEQRSRELLHTVGVDRYMDEPARTLSRGALQRVEICRAVLHEPELLLLDEPNSHLDPSGWSRIEPLIGRELRTTRVLVTHDISSGLKEADVALCLFEGRVVLFQRTQNLEQSQIRGLYEGSAQ